LKQSYEYPRADIRLSSAAPITEFAAKIAREPTATESLDDSASNEYR